MCALDPASCSGFKKDKYGHISFQPFMSVLRQANLAWEAQLPANQIGVHPENRDGCGILVSHVQRLIEELCELGYDSQLTRNICVEIPRDRVPSEDFNIKLADGSGGALAKVAPGTLRFLSLSGGHTNQAIKAIAAGCQHQSAQLTMDGSLSMAKIKEKCPELARVAEQGQMWVVLSSHAISRFPAIPRLVQSAANASTHLAAAESELQLARKVLRAYLSASETKASGVTWLDISSEVLRSKPPHMKVAPAMFKFIMNYAGGKSGHMLSATEAFVNTCGVNKSLGFELWDCISQESKGKSKIPRLLARHAALKLAYLQEDVLVTCADIKKLLAGKELQPEVDKMESIILQIHKMGKAHEDACSGATLVKLQGLAECQLVWRCLDKKHRSVEWKHKSLEEVGHEFVERLSTACGKTLTSPWSAAVDASPPSALTSSSAGTCVLETSETGAILNLAAALKAAGFTVGLTLCRKADKATGKIMSVDDGARVVHMQVGDKLMNVSGQSVLDGEWRVVREKSPAKVIPWENPLQGPDFEKACLRGAMTTA